MATPAELLSDSQCVACSGTATMFQTFAITLLKQLTSMTQAEIEAESECWTCYGISQSEAAILVLLNNLVPSGSGTGGAGLVGIVNPEGSVTATAGTSYYNTVGFSFWYKTSGSGSTGWTQVV